MFFALVQTASATTLFPSGGGTGTTTYQTNSIPYFNGTYLTEKNGSLSFDGTKLKMTYASSTAISADTLCLNSDTCRSTWPSGSGGSGSIGTSSVGVIGSLLYYTTSGATPELVNPIATTSATISSGLAYSGTFGALVGGAAGSLTCTTGSATVFGCLTAANFNVFNNKIGTSSVLSANQVLYATGSNTAASVATTTQTFSGPFSLSAAQGYLVGGSSATITWSGLSTTTAIASGQVLYGTSASGVSSVATSSIGATAPITFSGTPGAQIGGASGTYGCTTASATAAGCIATVDWNAFNMKIATSAAETAGQVAVWSTTNGSPAKLYSVATSSETCTAPLLCAAHTVLAGGGAITWTGLATTSQPASSNLLVSNGAAGVYGVATTSETCTSPLSCTAHAVLTGGGAITITQSTASANGYLSSTDWNSFNMKVGTSSAETAGQLAAWGTTAGSPPKLYSVATTAVACSGNISCTAFTALGAASTISFTGTLGLSGGGTNASLSGANQVLFMNAGNTAVSSNSLHTYLASQGALLLGTTTAQFGLGTFGTSTTPQILLSDNTAADNMWTLRTISNALYIATSTATATSTTAALTFNGLSGAATFGSPATTTFSGGIQGTFLNLTSAGTSTISSNVVSPCFSNTIGGACLTSLGTPVSIANGGTNASSFGTTNGIVAYDGTRLVNFANFTLTSTLASILTASTTNFSNFGTAYFGGTATSTVVGDSATSTLLSSLGVTKTSGTAFRVNDGFGTNILNVSTASTTAGYDLLQLWSATSTGPLFAFDQYGHMTASSTAPVLSSCGTSPTLTTDSSDFQGTITVGSVAATGCTLTFGTPHTTNTHCVISNQTVSVVNAMTYTESTTGFVVSQTGLTSDKLDYICTGK